KLADDEGDQSASKDAFELLHLTAGKRLERRRLTVIDATSVRADARKQLLDIAKRYHAHCVAVVFDVPVELCQQYNQARPDRRVEDKVIRLHRQLLEQSLRTLPREHFHAVHYLRTPEEVAGVEIVREPLRVDRRPEHCPV